MAAGDGNGVVECSCGQVHWGLHGAAGLLLSRRAGESDPDGAPGQELVLLQHRADWSHFGGTWGLPGGARDSHENWAEAAMRETLEEAGLPPERVRPYGEYRADHGPWSYVTVLGWLTPGAAPEITVTPESHELRWVPRTEVHDYPLHPGLQASWLALNLPRTHLVVDVANVVGSVPDGWWRDRAGAAARLLSALAPLAGSATDLPEPELLMAVQAVVEGRARPAASGSPAGVDAVAAPADGDASIVDCVSAATRAFAEAPVDGLKVSAVTSDRGLAARVRELGADVWPVGRLLDLLEDPDD